MATFRHLDVWRKHPIFKYKWHQTVPGLPHGFAVASVLIAYWELLAPKKQYAHMPHDSHDAHDSPSHVEADDHQTHFRKHGIDYKFVVVDGKPIAKPLHS